MASHDRDAPTIEPAPRPSASRCSPRLQARRADHADARSTRSNFIDRTIVGIIGQPIKESLKITDNQLGLLGGLAFALLYTMLGVPIARLAERCSRVNIIADLHHPLVGLHRALRPGAELRA